MAQSEAVLNGGKANLDGCSIEELPTKSAANVKGGGALIKRVLISWR